MSRLELALSGAVFRRAASVLFPEDPVKVAVVLVPHSLPHGVGGQAGIGQQIGRLLQPPLLQKLLEVGAGVPLEQTAQSIRGHILTLKIHRKKDRFEGEETKKEPVGKAARP